MNQPAKKKKRESPYQKAFLPVLLKMEAPQLIKKVDFQVDPKKITAQVIHPNTQKVLWEKKYPKNTDLPRVWAEANERYLRLKKTQKTWVAGTEEVLKIDVSQYK